MGRQGAAQLLRPQDFQVVELRRYTMVEGGREPFARYFESYFPEAFQQLGALMLGNFFERRNPLVFSWLRGFKDLDARGAICGAFYHGPVWKEHRQKINDLVVDSENVLLLRPLSPARGVLVLPAVDPVREEPAARGVAVAQIYPLRAESVDAFVQQAEPHFAAYRAAGAREAGVLVTLDAVNNFPQHPIRSDGPFLVWLGLLENEGSLENDFCPLAERAAQSLAAGALLRGEPELVILDPAPRSRLRWCPARRS
jgi:hypothetical protein